MAIRFHLEEHVAHAVAEGLRARGIDVSTTSEAGLLGAPDEAHIAHGLRERRVIFTQDEDFLILAASGIAHAGLVYAKGDMRGIGQIIRHLELIYHCMSDDEMLGHVEFV